MPAGVRPDEYDGSSWVGLIAFSLDRATLLGSPGRVFTRAELIDRVWGDGFRITDRTIDSHVKALRRKISDAGAEASWIETVRGVGYRLSDDPSTAETP